MERQFRKAWFFASRSFLGSGADGEAFAKLVSDLHHVASGPSLKQKFMLYKPQVRSLRQVNFRGQTCFSSVADRLAGATSAGAYFFDRWYQEGKPPRFLVNVHAYPPGDEPTLSHIATPCRSLVVAALHVTLVPPAAYCTLVELLKQHFRNLSGVTGGVLESSAYIAYPGDAPEWAYQNYRTPRNRPRTADLTLRAT